MSKEKSKQAASKEEAKQADKAQATPKVKMVKTAQGYLRPEHSTRCSNCQERISIPLKAAKAVCPYCDMPYRISWVTPEQPRIKGAIWSHLPPQGPWPKGWPGELDSEGKPTKKLGYEKPTGGDLTSGTTDGNTPPTSIPYE